MLNSMNKSYEKLMAETIDPQIVSVVAPLNGQNSVIY